MTQQTIQETLWIPVARVQDLPVREGRVVTFGSREVAVFNLGDQVLVVDNRCPHKGGPLADGIVSGTTIVCPLHAWKFNLETGEGANTLSAANCIETFHTRVDNGILMIEFSPSLAGESQASELWKSDAPCDRAAVDR